jgi:tRNA(fMet)-specific endonuclease VapC
MRYLFDTNTCVAILADGWGVLTNLRVAPEEVGLSAITAWELEGGCVLSARAQENRHRLDALLAEVNPLPFAVAEARRAGELHATLERAGLRLSTADCLIAGHALALSLTLVTHDRDFSRVPGLHRVDWLPAGYSRGRK